MLNSKKYFFGIFKEIVKISENLKCKCCKLVLNLEKKFYYVCKRRKIEKSKCLLQLI